MMRIISRLPSATELVVAAGRGSALVGRSHECDYPPFIEALPVCTATKLERGLTSRQVEDRVQEIVRQGLCVYEVHAERLPEPKPDLIITQTQCAVCAGRIAGQLGRRAAGAAVPGPADAGRPVGRPAPRGGGAPRARKGGPGHKGLTAPAGVAPGGGGAGLDGRPRTACIEWIEPVMAAGDWAPELVQTAGGEPLFAAGGQHSALRLPYRRDAGRFARAHPRLVESVENLAAIFDYASGGSSRPDQRWIVVQAS